MPHLNFQVTEDERRDLKVLQANIGALSMRETVLTIMTATKDISIDILKTILEDIRSQSPEGLEPEDPSET